MDPAEAVAYQLQRPRPDVWRQISQVTLNGGPECWAASWPPRARRAQGLEEKAEGNRKQKVKVKAPEAAEAFHKLRFF